MLSLVTNYGEVSMLTSVLIVLKWQQINFYPVGDGDSNDNIDKKNLSKKSKLLFMATVCILTFHGAGDR